MIKDCNYDEIGVIVNFCNIKIEWHCPGGILRWNGAHRCRTAKLERSKSQEIVVDKKQDRNFCQNCDPVLVRVAIQNFLKNPVISMVLRPSVNNFLAYNFINPYTFKAIVEKRSSFSIFKRPYQKMY